MTLLEEFEQAKLDLANARAESYKIMQEARKRSDDILFPAMEKYDQLRFLLQKEEHNG